MDRDFFIVYLICTGFDLFSRRGQRKPVGPRHHVISGGAGGETVAIQPGGVAGGGTKRGIAPAKSAAGGGAEGHQGLAGEVVALDKGTHDTRRFASPDRVA